MKGADDVRFLSPRIATDAVVFGCPPAYNVVMRSTHVSGDDYPHRGVTMHEMPVAANVPGLVFAIGSALIFLFAIPALWYVVVAAAIVGLLVSAFLQLFHRSHPDEAERLRFRL